MKKLPLIIVILALSTTWATSFAAELFRWTDENGKVHYTDRVPPQYIEKGFRVISEQGLTIKTIRPFSEELANRPEEKTIDTEQLEKDRFLFMSYSNEAELITARDRKLADIDAIITISQEAITLLESQFRNLTKEAGDYEKKGDAIPNSLQQDMGTTEKKIKNYENNIKRYQKDREKAEEQFETDLKRYRQITQQLK
jgi:hypothetical protein